MRRFHDKFSPCGFQWASFSPAYGLGEATLKVSCCIEGENPSVLKLDAKELEDNRAIVATAESPLVRTVVSSGTAHGETEIAIVDPEEFHPLKEGEVGEIWIKDPSVGMGYWKRKEESKQVFQAHLSNGRAPFLRTGDLGFLLESQLYVTGRLKELIIIRGSNHYPQDIEWSVQSAHEAVQGQTAVAFSIEDETGERLILLQEVSSFNFSSENLHELMSAIIAQIADDH